MKIKDFEVGAGSTYIIADIGINHNGDVETAKKLIRVASEAGCNAVKVPAWNTEETYSKEYLSLPFISERGTPTTFGAYRKSLELSPDELKELKQAAVEAGVHFIVNPFDVKSLESITQLVDAFYVSSSDVTNLELIERIALQKKPVIMSTGMSSMEEINAAFSVLKENSADLALMHSVSVWPSKAEHVNLKAILELEKEFKVPIGYSGHERGISITTAAIALGAKIVKRNITLDRTMPGPEHANSLEPKGLSLVVRDAREIEKAIQGEGLKTILEEERELRASASKSIVTKRLVREGETIKKEDLGFKSPGIGIQPVYVDSVIGKKALRDLPEDSIIKPEYLSE